MENKFRIYKGYKIITQNIGGRGNVARMFDIYLNDVKIDYAYELKQAKAIIDKLGEKK